MTGFVVTRGSGPEWGPRVDSDRRIRDTDDVPSTIREAQASGLQVTGYGGQAARASVLAEGDTALQATDTATEWLTANPGVRPDLDTLDPAIQAEVLRVAYAAGVLVVPPGIQL